jgi:hypothetical protein
MMTTYERGQRAMAIEMMLLQLEARFGPLSPEVKSRVEALSSQQLKTLALDFVKAQSLNELGLEG